MKALCYPSPSNAIPFHTMLCDALELQALPHYHVVQCSVIYPLRYKIMYIKHCYMKALLSFTKQCHAISYFHDDAPELQSLPFCHYYILYPLY